MEAKKTSRTAYGTTLFRAIESKKPEDKRVCYDPMAVDFLEFPINMMAKSRFFGQRILAQFSRRGLGASYAFPVIRTKVIDDLLRGYLKDGIDQLVILGAGFDSRAYRFNGLSGNVTVFEVDHPATQQVKVKKVKKLFGNIPGHVVFVPVDLEGGHLGRALAEKGFVQSAKTFFIFEGLTLYLSCDTVDEIFTFIAECSGTGSVVVFDYVYTSAADENKFDDRAMKWNEFLKRLGEPPRFGIQEGAIGEYLASRGLRLCENLPGSELESEYFIKFGQDQEVTPFMALAIAVISD